MSISDIPNGFSDSEVNELLSIYWEKFAFFAYDGFSINGKGLKKMEK
ncbi:hypothetical protein MTBBW1_530026 [Desulfamplus magnetovallimortis]|uniref:Uncharacterized protein n=1 Tax=Desulfamplus magnetovallimortis TaxID=1246637 RepID=A0A1W1HHN8_9BACT|nr:hypothetical protein [Desulfamplus magnetovallimortis]SLM32021.1 hypothetical protein MTBBW1_530026 [Desulfamplus magnetovallimortis]